MPTVFQVESTPKLQLLREQTSKEVLDWSDTGQDEKMCIFQRSRCCHNHCQRGQRKISLPRKCSRGWGPCKPWVPKQHFFDGAKGLKIEWLLLLLYRTTEKLLRAVVPK